MIGVGGAAVALERTWQEALQPWKMQDVGKSAILLGEAVLRTKCKNLALLTLGKTPILHLVRLPSYTW